MKKIDAIEIGTGRLLKIGRGAQEEFYGVNVGYGVIVLRKDRSTKTVQRNIIDVNGYVGFKFKNNVYQTEQKTVVITPRLTKVK